MTFIINSATANADLNQLGGKAKALAALSGQGLPIPQWFVLSPKAFDYSLTEEQRSHLAAGHIAVVLESLKLDAAIQSELETSLAALCPNGEQVAVRSSALDEDGETHSFAGQLDSFLCVEPHDVAAQVVAVWRSGFSDRILAYRREKHLPFPEPPAVLIQVMVNADVAGVGFGADPVTGQRDIAVVSAVYGLGTLLVSGEADADTYRVSQDGHILQRHIADKRVAYQCSDLETIQDTAIASGFGDVSCDQSKQGVIPVPVAEALVAQPALTDAQVRAIATLIHQVSTYFGTPQDIEWAIARDQLYLLQARPITTLADLPKSGEALDGVLNVWDNSNIAESYGGVTTPLTFSFARRAYEEVYRQFCRMMGVPKQAIAQHDTTFRRMLGLVQGRIYYNLLNWYRVLALLPGFTVNRRFMEQMMGVKEELPSDVLATLKQSSFRDRLNDSIRLAKTLVGLLKNYITLPQQIQRFYQRLNHALSLPNSALKTMRPDELSAHYYDLERQLLTRWDAPLINDFFAMIFYGVLRSLTTRWCGDAKETLQNNLISGEGGMISAEPAWRVGQMAALASPDRSFTEFLCSGSLLEILQQMNAEFRHHYDEYLEKFGDRCLEELKLESPTLHDDPLLLLRSVGNLAKRYQAQPPTQLSTNARLTAGSLRLEAEAQIHRALSRRPLHRFIFNWVLKNARNRVRDRENLRFERTRLFGRVRRIVVELGERYHALGLLTSPRDVFYLELEEVLGVIDGTATCTDLNGLISVRQAEFETYRTHPAPGDRFETRGMVHPFTRYHSQPSPLSNSEPSAGDVVQGMGCCPGIVRAPVQVITDPSRAELRQGSILVAERTDPGWIMLFPAAAGLLVERGSLLSHSAIVAREMGIPAIVSLPNITRWLKDGDWVEMDGASGVVRRLSVETAAVSLNQPDREFDAASQPPATEVATYGQ